MKDHIAGSDDEMTSSEDEDDAEAY